LAHRPGGHHAPNAPGHRLFLELFSDLTAWSAGGIVGPQMIAFLKKRFSDEPAKAAELAFWLSAAFLGIGLILAICWRDVAQSRTELGNQPGE
jgi:hypothetical protein